MTSSVRSPRSESHRAPESGAAVVSGAAPGGAAPLVDGAAERGERLLRLALLVSLATGALLRVMQFAAGRAVWLDEAVLASSITGRGWSGLFRPLDYGQTAPPGFLLLEKGAVSLLGGGEHALRLVPLLAGLAALFLFPAVARRFVSRPAAVLATALFALAPFLVYYSSEVKQYSLDVLVALLVLACAADASPALGRGEKGPRASWRLLAVGVVAVWLSQPAVLVLAGCGVALLWEALAARDRTRARTLVWVGAAWVASFAASYLLSRRMMSDPEYMRAFWKSGFMPLPPRSVQEAAWILRAFVEMFREPLGVYGEDTSLPTRLQTYGGALAFVAGCAALWRARRPALAMLALPVLLVVLTAAAGLYPLGGDYPTAGRVLTFLVPSLVLVMAAGVAATVRLLPARAGTAAAAVISLVLLAPSLGYAALGVPHTRAEIKPLLEYAREQRQDGDVLYVHYRALPSFDYYAARDGWSGPAVVRGACSRLRPTGYLEDVARLRGRGRVWVLFVDAQAAANFNEREFITRYLDHIGWKTEGQLASGAWLYLYDLSDASRGRGTFRSAAPAAPREYDAALDCRGPWARTP